MSQSNLSLSRRSLADQVSDLIVELILKDGLVEGDRLPPTAELVERFGVSRTVLREALASLAGRGVVSRSQGKECVVATPGAANLTSLLQFRIRKDAVSVADIMQVRLALEVSAARACATSRSEAHLALMRAQLDALAAARTDRAYHAADVALHRAIAEGSGNPLLALILDALGEFLTDVRVRATANRRRRGGTLDQAVEEHRNIIDAVESRDPEAAEQAMLDHLRHTADELEVS